MNQQIIENFVDFITVIHENEINIREFE